MKRLHHPEQQTLAILREGEAGDSVKETLDTDCQLEVRRR
jgi:hypothetical protein